MQPVRKTLRFSWKTSTVISEYLSNELLLIAFCDLNGRNQNLDFGFRSQADLYDALIDKLKINETE